MGNQLIKYDESSTRNAIVGLWNSFFGGWVMGSFWDSCL